MGWDKLDLHVENLVPGLATTGLLLLIIAEPLPAVSVPAGAFSSAVPFLMAGAGVAVAYLIGIFAVVLARLLVDAPSEFLVRPAMLISFSHEDELEGFGFLKDRKKINQRYRTTVGRVLRGTNEKVKAEVIKRRERGRLLRTALVPLWLGLLILAPSEIAGLPVAGSAFLLGVVAWFVVLGLYAYVEATIYQEAMLDA